MRTYYEIDNGFLSNISYDTSYKFPYLMFIQDDELIVNRNSDYKAPTKESILFDIEIIAKRIAQKIGNFSIIKGLTPEFIEKLETEYNINYDEIKGASENGKNNYQRRNHNRTMFSNNIERVKGFTVGYQR